MKKILSLVLVLMMALSVAAMAEDMPVVKIGVFEPASGNNGAGGKQETLGMQYANAETPTVTIGDTEYKVELVIEDNQSSEEKAQSAAQSLVSAGVSVALGSYGSTVAMAGSATFEAAGVPVIGVTCTNPQVTLGNDHYFRICFLDPFQGTVLANYAYKELGATKAYTLSQQGSDYDAGLVYYFTEAFKALGGEVEGDTFPDGTAEFRPYLTTAMNDGAQVFFAPCSTNFDSLMIQQADELGVTFPLMGGDTWDNNMVVESAKGKSVQVLISTFYQEGGNPTFDEGFKKWMNENPEALTNNGGNDMIAAVSVMGYDAYYTALEALKAAGSTDPAAVKAALPNVTYTGVTGAIAFDENGDALRDTAYIKTSDNESGTWTFVAEQGVE